MRRGGGRTSGAIAHNVAVLREHAGSAQVMAVVKADGYGHGATRVGRAALAAGAAELGVATVDEALAICAATASPRRCWPGCTHRAPTSRRRSLADVQIAVSSVRQLDELLDAVSRTGSHRDA